MAKHITFLISPLVGQTSSFIRNSQHFVEIIKDLKLLSNEVTVSFDNKSLLTNVPIDEALEVFHRLLLEDETLGDRTTLSADQVINLLNLCLRLAFFMFRGEYYQQQDGAAMGSPVFLVLANIYMKI